MPLIHILFDLENLQPTAEEIALVLAEPYRLWVFRGPHQKKYDAALAEAWQPLGDRVQFIRCARSGKDALDFHIAFVMGRIVGTHDRAGLSRNGAAEFVVVSKDNGFDALFEYVRSLGYRAEKASSLTEATQAQLRVESSKQPPSGTAKTPPPVPMPQSSTGKQATRMGPAPPNEKLESAEVEKIVDHLRMHPKNRPATRQALQRYIPTVPGISLSPELIEKAISVLEHEGVVTYTGKKTSYKIPKKQA